MKLLLLGLTIMFAGSENSCVETREIVSNTTGPKLISTEVRLPDNTFVFCVYGNVETYRDVSCDWEHVHAKPALLPTVESK